MRAAVIEAKEQPPVVRDDVPAPEPGPGEVLIDVGAAALNPVELHIWRGTYRDGDPQTPYVPGVEGVGTLEDGTRVRFEVPKLHPGYGTDGALAQQAVAPADAITKLTDDVDTHLAAALGATGITALRVLEVARVTLGDTVLVLGATGMVGRSAVQLAKALGAVRVVAAGRDAAALQRATELGADATVVLDDRPRARLIDELREAGGDGGINVVVDPLWGEPALLALEAARVDVVHVNVGRAAGDPIALPHPLLLRKRATIRGLSTAMESPAERAAAFKRLLDHVRAGHLRIDFDVLPLADIADGWQRLADGAGRKLVVSMT